MESVKCLIIGGGPAGYTAAIYTARASLSPVLYEGMQPGGQLTTTTDVENFPGFEKGVSGQTLMDSMRAQAVRVGADLRSGMVTAADLSSRPFRITVDGEKEISAETLIIATGATAKYLGLPSEEKFKGMGVSACATCDGFFYRGKDVAVVGGGNTALEDALFLSNYCRKVYLIHRRDEFRGESKLLNALQERDNVEFILKHIVTTLKGEKLLSAITLQETDTTEEKYIPENILKGIGIIFFLLSFMIFILIDILKGNISFKIKKEKTVIQGIPVYEMPQI